ncbi:MAG: undecaprenyldiphospho-muramoylpentapeptide beta-N-acetylglucosaminyltransferase [Clostridia bacterium]
MKKIILTGGGSAGHVTPNLALIPKLVDDGFEIHYIGTVDGIERKLIANVDGVIYHVVSAGKLRRYFSIKNFTDPFKLIKGISQAKKIIKDVKPNVIFSKGGFVSVPVVIAAKKRAPVISHESDYTPGLANKIGAKYAQKVCVTFLDTIKFVGKKAVHTGTPIRKELFMGKRERGLNFLGFSGEKPLLLAMGGSLGAQGLNAALRSALPELLKLYDIVHICGAGKVDEDRKEKGYAQFEYIRQELPDVFAAADFALSRAGANAIFEFLALHKPALLVPLPSANSRGDQDQNADYFVKKGYAMSVKQEELSPEKLLTLLTELYEKRKFYEGNMEKEPTANGTNRVYNVIMEVMKQG